MDMGALTAFFYGFRDREKVLDILEQTTGGRLIQAYNTIGGVQADIHPEVHDGAAGTEGGAVGTQEAVGAVAVFFIVGQRAGLEIRLPVAVVGQTCLLYTSRCV